MVHTNSSCFFANDKNLKYVNLQRNSFEIYKIILNKCKPPSELQIRSNLWLCSMPQIVWIDDSMEDFISTYDLPKLVELEQPSVVTVVWQ